MNHIDEQLNEICRCFEQQLLNLDETAAIVKYEERPEWAAVLPLVWAAKESCKAILLLARVFNMRDCFILSRTAFETFLNVCFIFAQGMSAFQRAKLHALQKSYRDLNRQSKFGKDTISIKLSGVDKIPVDRKLKHALALFTSKKGREITRWTPESPSQKIEIIEKKYTSSVTTGFKFGLAALYRNASELSHGTLYGSYLALGIAPLGVKPDSPEKIKLHFLKNITMILLMVTMSIDSYINILDLEFGAKSLRHKSKDVLISFSRASILQKEK